MGYQTEIITHGGTMKPEEDSKWHVTYWYVPGGSDYVNASVQSGYFSDKEAADRFAEKYSNGPEMACVQPYKPTCVSDIVTQ